MNPTSAPRPSEANLPHLDLLELLIAEHQASALPRLARLWSYYRNDMTPAPGSPGSPGSSGTPGSGAAALARTAGAGAARPYRLAQEQGLPGRLTGRGNPSLGASELSAGPAWQREIVIENDIAWRLHVMVDFMFGRPFTLQSLCPGKRQAGKIEDFLHRVFEANGSIGFFQDLALLGGVYGFVDVLLRPDAALAHRSGPLDDPARAFQLELIEAPRAIALLDPDDYRRLDAYILHFQQQTHEVETAGLLSRVRQRLFNRSAAESGGSRGRGHRAVVERTQVWTDAAFADYRGPADQRVCLEQAVNPLGRIPVVHIQNLAQPFFYEGLSEVEPLIPLQDELNTRLSDRANRVTFQSFKMYLGKGIDGFTERPVGPGQMWAADDPEASIQEFGGDADSPSESAHIAEIRAALDKASGVTEVAGGLLRDKVGSLTSENALRIVLMGLLARTQKKRLAYGAGIARLCELILHAADVLGVLPNEPGERAVELHWPSPLPENQTQQLQDAKLKLDLGVPREQVLAELGYGDISAIGGNGD